MYVELFGLYFKKIKFINDLKKGDIIVIFSDLLNGGRVLILLYNKGVIILKDFKNLFVIEFDIVKNFKKLKFKLIEVV